MRCSKTGLFTIALSLLTANIASAVQLNGVNGIYSSNSLHAAATNTSSTTSSIPQVHGIYVTDPVRGDGTIDPSVLNSSVVDGFLLRVTWASVEPAEGTYSWTQLDSQIAQAAGAGKKVTIAVSGGVGTPTWLYADGAKSFSWIWDSKFNYPICSVQKMPLPWDAIFLSRWRTFINAMGAHYDTNPTVAGIKMSAISSESWETTLPVSVNAKLSSGATSCTGYDNVSNWQKAGYNRTLMENTWDTLTSYFAAAFPDKQLIPMIIPAGFPPIDETGTIFSGKEHVISQYILVSGSGTYGAQFGAQNNALSASWIWPTLESYATSIDTGYQTTAALGTSLGAAATLAIGGGAQYLELYKADITNTALSLTLQGIHASLN